MPDFGQFYLRKYQIKVANAGTDALDVSNLRCTFQVEKNYMQSYQYGEITIYNLDPLVETSIIENGSRVILEAGYQEANYGTIFDGDIFQWIRGKENETTYFLKLICIDGDDFLNLSHVGLTMEAGFTARDIALQTARSATVSKKLNVDKLSDQKTQRAKVLFGPPKDILRQIARNNNASFYCDNGEANISKLEKDPLNAEAVLLNAQSGLIGMPQQIENGVRLRTLINPRIKINEFIKLNNKDVRLAQVSFPGFQQGQWQNVLDLDGIYRVIRIIATGDTRGQEWYYDLETVTQNGFLPSMLSDQYSSGF